LLGSSADHSNATVNVTLADASARRLSVQEGPSYAVTASYTATLSSAQMEQLAGSRATDGAAASSLFDAALADSTYTITPEEASFTAALTSVNTQTALFLSYAGLEAASPAPTVATPAPTQGAVDDHTAAYSNSAAPDHGFLNASNGTAPAPEDEVVDSGAHSSASFAVFATGAVVVASLALI